MLRYSTIYVIIVLAWFRSEAQNPQDTTLNTSQLALSTDIYTRARTKINLQPGFKNGTLSSHLHNLNISSYPGFVSNKYSDPSTDPTFFTQNPGLPVGTTDGVPNVDQSGAFNYYIPIKCSPGTAGIQPNLAIIYNSNSPNGWLGRGFNLEGISSISRVPNSLFYDGTKKPVSFNTDDKFMLDGLRLVAQNWIGNYNGAIFKTEIENYNVISSHGQNTPQYFTVITPDGRKMEYGNSSDSRYTDTQNNETITWYINKLSDKFGNYMEFEYQKVNGECVIKEIRYTGNINGFSPYNKIEFEFFNKSDIVPYYFSNGLSTLEFRKDKILKSVTCRSIGNVIFRKYMMDYVFESGTKLRKITEIDANGNQLSPTFFDWNLLIPAYSGPTVGGLLGQQRLGSNQTNLIAAISADVDGDNHQERVCVKNDSLNSTGDTYIESENEYWTIRNLWNGMVNILSMQAWDGNDDGRSEVYITWLPPGASTYYVTRYEYDPNNGVCTDVVIHSGPINPLLPPSFLDPGHRNFWSHVPRSMFSFNLADISGDDLNDIVISDHSGLYVDPSSAAPFYLAGDDIIKMSIGDYNGDGTGEIFVLRRDEPICQAMPYILSWYKVEVYKYVSSSNSLQLILSRGYEIGMQLSNFCNPNTLKQYYFNGARSFDFNDVNGDGKTDIMHLDFLGNGTADVYIDYATGATFLSQSKLINVNATISNFEAVFSLSDIDNNGLADLCISANDNVNSVAFFSSYANCGGGFIQGHSTSYSNLFSSVVGDFDGDGTLDFLSQTSSTGAGYYIVNLFNIEPVRRVTKIHNLKNEYKVEYSPLDAACYQKTNSLNSSNYVVGKPSTFVVKSSYFNLVQLVYGYGNALIHRGGKGFVGFEKTFCQNITLSPTPNGSWQCYRTTIRENIFDPSIDAVVISERRIMDGSSTNIFLTPVNKKLSDYQKVNTTYIGTGAVRYLSNTTIEEKNYLNSTRFKIETYYDNSNGGQILSQKRTDLGWLNSSVIHSHETAFLYTTLNLPTGTVYLPQERTDTYSAGVNTKAIRTDYTFDVAGHLQTITENANVSGMEVTTTFSDWTIFGLAKKSIVTAADLSQPREITRLFESTGRFIIKSTNSIGDFSEATYDGVSGNCLSKTETNGLVTRYKYNGLGYLTETKGPNGAINSNKMEWYSYTENRYSTPKSVYAAKIYSSREGMGSSTTYYDVTGNVLKVEGIDFGGLTIEKTISYDAIGRPVFENSLKYNTQTDYVKTEYKYDEFSRLTEEKEVLPGNSNSVAKVQSTTFSSLSDDINYNPGSITVESQTSGSQGTVKLVRINNEAGQIHTVKNISGNEIHSTHYLFNEWGKPSKVTNTFPNLSNSVTDIGFDALGRQNEIDEAGLGQHTFDYNSVGELTTSTSPSGTTDFTYDQLGRILTKNISGMGLYSYQYITSNSGKGQVWKITGPDATTEYAYDDFSRVTQKTENLTGSSPKQFQTQYTYDKYHRLVNYTYPSGFTKTNVYDIYGNLTEIKSGNTIIWELKDKVAPDKVSQFAYNNSGLVTDLNYDSFLNLDEINFANINKQKYAFHPSSHDLVSRTNFNFVTLSDNNEHFKYDDFDRLIRTGYADNQNPDIQKLNFSYQGNGNFINKEDCGDYDYTQQNAPFKLTGISNPVGNLSINTLGISYNSIDKVNQITEGTTNKQYDIVYGNTESRIKMSYKINGQLQYMRYYQDNYDREETANGYREWNYIYTPTGLSAVYFNNNGTTQILYVNCDHQGSPVLVTNGAGTILEEYSFDSWGRRRNPLNWNDYSSGVSSLFMIRGYTGHEHLDEVKLINMNGRVYDPVLGRFIQPDSYVQAPDNLQSFNRYSYCWNNPLKYTDPSGYFTWNDGIAVGLIAGGAFLCATGVAAPLGASMIVPGVSHFGETLEDNLNNGTSWDAASNNVGINISLNFTPNWGTKTTKQINEGDFEELGPGYPIRTREINPLVACTDCPPDGSSVAKALAAGWVISLIEPTPGGEFVMGFVTTSAILWYGPDLVAKMQLEIDNIYKKVSGPPGFQYALVATKDDYYENVRGGATYLRRGAVWKYGETTQGFDRYSATYLRTKQVMMVPEFYGTQLEIKVVEKQKLYGYFFSHGTLPPGNAIFR